MAALASNATGHLVYGRWLLCHLLVIERPCRAGNDAFCKLSSLVITLRNVRPRLEPCNFALPKFPWMTFIKMEDELAYPEAVGFFSSFTKMSATAHLMNLIH